MDYKKLAAPCGLDCFNCEMYNAPEKYCKGCRDEKGMILPKLFEWHELCSVFKCIQEKGYDFCYECKDFPCDYLHPYADMVKDLPHNTKVFNLCLIIKMGLEKWAKEKAHSVKDKYFFSKFEFVKILGNKEIKDVEQYNEIMKKINIIKRSKKKTIYTISIL